MTLPKSTSDLKIAVNEVFTRRKYTLETEHGKHPPPIDDLVARTYASTLGMSVTITKVHVKTKFNNLAEIT